MIIVCPNCQSRYKFDEGKLGDRPKAKTRCSKCGSASKIKSREAHPERGPKYELQTFACPECGATDTREVYTPGANRRRRGGVDKAEFGLP
jgi:predicted Zn finger-like uncharacterized protein